MSTIKKDDRVFDKADPRHVGIVLKLRPMLTALNTPTALVQWEETGWLSNVHMADL